MCKARRRKVSRRLDENWQNEYTPSHEKSLRVGFYYEVLDIVFNEFNSRFNQESRMFFLNFPYRRITKL